MVSLFVLMLSGLDPAYAAAEVQLRSTLPVVMFVDGERARRIGMSRLEVEDLEPGVHEVQIKSLLGRILHEESIEIPDDTLVEAYWARGELKVRMVPLTRGDTRNAIHPVEAELTATDAPVDAMDAAPAEVVPAGLVDEVVTVEVGGEVAPGAADVVVADEAVDAGKVDEVAVEPAEELADAVATEVPEETADEESADEAVADEGPVDELDQELEAEVAEAPDVDTAEATDEIAAIEETEPALLEEVPTEGPAVDPALEEEAVAAVTDVPEAAEEELVDLATMGVGEPTEPVETVEAVTTAEEPEASSAPVRVELKPGTLLEVVHGDATLRLEVRDGEIVVTDDAGAVLGAE